VAPKARPWEREDLWRRLRTFRAGSWFCKPPPAGPVECARRGWVNAGQDLLSCEVGFRRVFKGVVLSFRYRVRSGITEAGGSCSAARTLSNARLIGCGDCKLSVGFHLLHAHV